MFLLEYITKYKNIILPQQYEKIIKLHDMLEIFLYKYVHNHPNLLNINKDLFEEVKNTYLSISPKITKKIYDLLLIELNEIKIVNNINNLDIIKENILKYLNKEKIENKYDNKIYIKYKYNEKEISFNLEPKEILEKIKKNTDEYLALSCLINFGDNKHCIKYINTEVAELCLDNIPAELYNENLKYQIKSSLFIFDPFIQQKTTLLKNILLRNHENEFYETYLILILTNQIYNTNHEVYKFINKKILKEMYEKIKNKLNKNEYFNTIYIILYEFINELINNIGDKIINIKYCSGMTAELFLLMNYFKI